MRKTHPVALFTNSETPGENDEFENFVAQCCTPDQQPQHPSVEEKMSCTAAHATVKKHVLLASAAGTIPSPLIDLSAVMAIQIDLVRRLAQIYSVPYRESLGKSLIASLIGGVIPVCGAPLAASLLKFIPAVGSLLGSFSVAAMAAATTYATGRVFIMHFESGGTLLNFDPQAMRSYYREIYQTTKLDNKTS